MSWTLPKKEMLTVVVAIKHWFADLANLRVLIYVDNQACVSLINNGISKSPFLAACLREVNYFLAKYNIDLRAEYVPSKENHLADLCSRAFMSENYFVEFNKLLTEGTLKLDYLHYDKFCFDLEL